jgi:hypothetical protein
LYEMGGKCCRVGIPQLRDSEPAAKLRLPSFLAVPSSMFNVAMTTDHRPRETPHRRGADWM